MKVKDKLGHEKNKLRKVFFPPIPTFRIQRSIVAMMRSFAKYTACLTYVCTSRWLQELPLQCMHAAS